MGRTARIVMPDYPHHIIQRGNCKQKVFFNDDDKIAYLDYLCLYAKPAGIDIWAYCLMDNHVHLIVVPEREESLAVGLVNAHVRYTRGINFREGWRGYLWEGRFKSYVMSERHLYAAIRYVESNPVRAGIVKKAEKYNWSSAKAHVNKTKDSILSDNFLISEIKDWAAYLAEEDREEDKNVFMQHSLTGRPLGDDKYLEELEIITGRNVKKKTPGPKKRVN